MYAAARLLCAYVCKMIETSINDKYVRIDTWPQRGFENTPDRLVIRGANTGNGIINQALYSSVLLRTDGIVTDTSDVAPGVALPLEEDAVGVRGGALLATGIEILRSRIVLIRGWESDRGFLETTQYRTLVQNGPQLILVQVYRRFLRKARVCDPLDHLLPRLSQTEVQVAAPEHAIKILRHV